MTTARSSGPYFIETEVHVQDGEYAGHWGGYIVRMYVNGKTIVFKTDVGIRSPSVAVTVKMKNGNATVELTD